MTKLKKAFANPALIVYGLWAKFNRRSLYNRYQKLSRIAGLDKVYFILSFDCDTPDDIDVVWNVHSRMMDIGVKSVYAVPGELLEEGKMVYRRILENGGEFINHGYKQHTYFDASEGTHRSCFFYDELPLQQIREDMIRGDTCLRETMGVEAQGFRTPHFGSFQRPHQLRLIHSVLRDLRYRFSTSTLPLFAFRYGPIFKAFGELELPLTGMVRSPLKILDSWGCFEAPNRSMTPRDYLNEGKAVANLFKTLGIGLLNFYVDPSHISDSDIFFETVAHWQSIAKAVTYNELLDGLS